MGMAGDRFDTRRGLVLQEATTIGTTYLRAGYLPEPAATELQAMLRDIMDGIHARCLAYGERNGHVDYVRGANIAGFKKVADAMLAFGVV